MFISFSTDRMKIIKLCFLNDHKNDVLNHIANNCNLELIDIEKKGGFTQEGEIDQKISTLFSTIQQINSSLGTLFVYSDLNGKKESTKSITAFTSADQAVDAAQAFLDAHGAFLSSIEDKRRLATLLHRIKPLKIDPKLIGESDYFYSTVGQIKTENLKDVEWRLNDISNKNLVFSAVVNEEDKKNSTLIAGTTINLKPDMIRILTSYGFNEIQVPEIIHDLDGDIETIEADIRKEEEEFLSEKCFELLALEEQLKLAKERIEAGALIRKEGKHGYLAGWIPSKNVKKSVEEIKKVNDSIIVEIEDIKFPEHRYPCKMNNNRLVRPYEQLVSSFGSPGYNEIDPTKIFFVMFPFLFGLMFADVLHGFFVVMLGFLGGRSKEPLVPPTGIIPEFTGYFRQGSAVFMYCGMSSMIFGFLFGSFGGLHGDANPFFKALWFLPLAKGVLQHEGYQATDFNPFTGTWENLPTSTFDGQFALLEVSILVAAIVLSLGLFLNFYNTWKHGHRVHAITLPGAFLLFYIGLIGQLFSYGMNLADWFSADPAGKNIDLLNVPYIRHFSIPNPSFGSLSLTMWIFLAANGFLIFYHVIWTAIKHSDKLLDHMSEWLEYTISLISNTISFARLMAIAIVHGILSGVGNQYLGFINIPFPMLVSAYTTQELGDIVQIPILGLLIGGALVTGLEIMVALIQSIRLSWVEFFTKMAYQGTGKLFSPYKANYTFLKPYTSIKPA